MCRRKVETYRIRHELERVLRAKTLELSTFQDWGEKEVKRIKERHMEDVLHRTSARHC